MIQTLLILSTHKFGFNHYFSNQEFHELQFHNLVCEELLFQRKHDWNNNNIDNIVQGVIIGFIFSTSFRDIVK
jgi:hypothetical protein